MFYFYVFSFKVFSVLIVFLIFKISYFIDLKSFLWSISIINVVSKKVILGNNYLTYEKMHAF